MLQPNTAPATPFLQRLRSEAGGRTLGIGLAILVEGLLLLLLLSLGVGERPDVKEKRITVLSLDAEDAPQTEAEPSPEREQQAEERPAQQRPQPEQAPLPQPTEPLPAQPVEAPPAPAAPPPVELPVPPAIAPTRARPAPSGGAVYGPPNTGASASRDTERVGTAPNGEPLYAAAWYREPREAEMRAYLSTARGPGWGLIACRTAPGYRVEDCVALDEYPSGSQINRAILAAAWEFKVRPPQRGGRSLVGSWVRIRIDYGTKQRPRSWE